MAQTGTTLLDTILQQTNANMAPGLRPVYAAALQASMNAGTDSNTALAVILMNATSIRESAAVGGNLTTLSGIVDEARVPLLTLGEAMAILDDPAQDLPERYNIDPETVTEAGDKTVAQATDGFTAATGVLAGAGNQAALAGKTPADLVNWNIVDAADSILADTSSPAIVHAVSVAITDAAVNVAQASLLLALANFNNVYALADTLVALQAAETGLVAGAQSYALTNEPGDLGRLSPEQVALVQGASNAEDFTWTLGPAELTLAQALALGEELPADYRIDAEATLVEDDLGLEAAEARLAQVMTILANAENAGELVWSDLFAYSLLDDFATLWAAQTAGSMVLAEAVSYALSDEPGSLGTLSSAQGAFVRGASNYEDGIWTWDEVGFNLITDFSAGTDGVLDVFVAYFEADDMVGAFAEFGMQTIEGYNQDDGDLLLLIDNADLWNAITNFGSNNPVNSPNGHARINFNDFPSNPGDQWIEINGVQPAGLFGSLATRLGDLVNIEVEHASVIAAVGLEAYVADLLG